MFQDLLFSRQYFSSTSLSASCHVLAKIDELFLVETSTLETTTAGTTVKTTFSTSGTTKYTTVSSETTTISFNCVILEQSVDLNGELFRTAS